MLLQVIANKMKKTNYFAVLVGVLAGVVIGGGLILNNVRTAYSAEESGSFFNHIIAAGENFSWNDVFSTDVPEDLYLLIYKKLQTDGDSEAKVLVAQNSGYTGDELEAILDGSVTPILNERGGSLTLTNEEALGLVLEVQENYLEVKDLLDASNEVEVLIAPSEIFSNGDLSDSGFDLVHDLTTIEEILFVETKPVTVGEEFSGRVDSAAEIAESFVPNVAETEKELRSEGEKERKSERVEEDFVVAVGESEIKGRRLVADICEADSHVGRALTELENEETRELGREGVGDGLIEPEEDEELALGTITSALTPAPAGQWGSEWCPGFPEFDGTYDNFSEGNIGGFLDGFKSLGGQSPTPLFAAAGTNYESEAVKLDASICLTISMVRTTYESYYPGKTCVLCEVRKINQYLDQTMSHSLIPNKATGNLLESAKCKETGTLFNMQFILMYQPVMQPLNDKLIFGGNIFEEWNNFAKKYQPSVIGDNLNFPVEWAADTSNDGLSKAVLRSAPGSLTTLEALNEVREAKDYYQMEALRETGERPKAQEAANALFYDHSVLMQMKEMNGLFNALNIIFNNINDGVVPEIKAKPDLG